MISLIAAIQKDNRGLGFQNQLLYRITDDLKRFKALTTGNIIIMGRKTFESIGKALPDRTNIIVTKNPDFTAPNGVLVAHSLGDALAQAALLHKDIFIIGGGEIYNQSIAKADRLYLTVVDANNTADTFFPDYSDFKKILSEEEKIDEKTGLSYSFQILEK